MRTVSNPNLDNLPMRLTDEERQNPYIVLEDFFSFFHLQDIREELWDWLVAALSSESGEFGSGHARSNLLFVYEKLERLIEAAHGLNKRRKREKKRRRKWKQKI